MNRIPSFTEYGLLNRWALDLFSPADFQKLPISSSEDTALAVLRQTTRNIYSNSKNGSYWYGADKFYLLTPLKVIYIGCVTLTLSRIGVVVNSCLTIYSYINYKLAKPSNVEQAWEKTQNCAYALFADLTCAAGSVLTKVIVENTLYALHFARLSSLMGKCHLSLKDSIASVVVSVVAVVFSSMCLIALQHPQIAPQFFTKQQDRVGMYLSLSLRKNLGLVSENGGLLPFSEKDRLEYRESDNRFEGSNYQTLYSQLVNAEVELIETVQKCNRLLPPHKKIQFQYPFNGEILARSLEASSKQVSNTQGAVVQHDPNSLTQFIHKLRSLQLKIDFSTEIFKNAQRLTAEDSLPIKVIKMAFRVSYIEINFRKRDSYLSSEDYRECFNSCSGNNNSPRSVSTESNELWKSLELTSLDPNSIPRPSGDLFNQFKYDICVNKWLCDQGETPKSFRELLGLVKNTPHQQYVRIKRKYQLAIHPDKNKENTEVATKVFQCLETIIEQLNQEYDK